MERSRMLRFQSGLTHRQGCTTRWRFRTELAKSARRAPTPQPVEQLTHRSNPLSLQSGQSQSAFSQPELLLRRSASLPLRPPPPQNRRSLLQHARRLDSGPSQQSGSALLPPARFQPVKRLRPTAEPVLAPDLRRLSQRPHRGDSGHSALSQFNSSSFSLNSGLCGEIINKECRSDRPFSVLRRMRRLRRSIRMWQRSARPLRAAEFGHMADSQLRSNAYEWDPSGQGKIVKELSAYCASSSEFGHSKALKGDRSRRSWSDREEGTLFAALKELVAIRWKSDNGFRTGIRA
ncbi:hypothetical protein SASPL_114832 [Salvia splendens]|uniref:Uncharacterized protein n=1 Tax=Salvia splendens TaxID=180675 RepID=A0A8X8Y430_SALSN|nr:hypothetical protein SASPL_114832 [Salvia splendens]